MLCDADELTQNEMLVEILRMSAEVVSDFVTGLAFAKFVYDIASSEDQLTRIDKLATILDIYQPTQRDFEKFDNDMYCDEHVLLQTLEDVIASGKLVDFFECFARLGLKPSDMQGLCILPRMPILNYFLRLRSLKKKEHQKLFFYLLSGLSYYETCEQKISKAYDVLLYEHYTTRHHKREREQAWAVFDNSKLIADNQSTYVTDPVALDTLQQAIFARSVPTKDFKVFNFVQLAVQSLRVERTGDILATEPYSIAEVQELTLPQLQQLMHTEAMQNEVQRLYNFPVDDAMLQELATHIYKQCQQILSSVSNK